jgi:hypothetical protein
MISLEVDSRDVRSGVAILAGQGPIGEKISGRDREEIPRDREKTGKRLPR